jgi:hypothetical protein
LGSMKTLVSFRLTAIAVTIITIITIPTAIAGSDSVISGAIIQAGMCASGDYICLVRLYSIVSGSLIVLCFLVDLAINNWSGKKSKRSFPKSSPEIIELLKIRQDGIELRNRGMGLITDITVHLWILTYISWKDRMVNALKRMDEEKAEWIGWLGNFVPTPMIYPHIVNDEHRKILEEFTETLERLEMVLRPYIDIPQKVQENPPVSINKST